MGVFWHPFRQTGRQQLKRSRMGGGEKKSVINKGHRKKTAFQKRENRSKRQVVDEELYHARKKQAVGREKEEEKS